MTTPALHARNLLGDLEYRRLQQQLSSPDPSEGSPTSDGARGARDLPRAADRGREQGWLFEEHEPKGQQGRLWE